MNTQATISLLAMCLALPACATFDEIPHDRDYDQLEARTYDMKNFHRINIDADGEIVIKRGDAYKVVIYTEPHHFPALKLNVDDGVLNVMHPDRKHSKSHVIMDIKAPYLDDIRIDAVVEANIENLKADNLNLHLSSVGDIEIEGVCENLKLHVSGIGDFDARNLNCNNVEAKVSGIGDTKIKALESISIRSSGIGDVSVYGNPRVNSSKASGIGDMNFKN